jgi:hypothetical protein
VPAFGPDVSVRLAVHMVWAWDEIRLLCPPRVRHCNRQATAVTSVAAALAGRNGRAVRVPDASRVGDTRARVAHPAPDGDQNGDQTERYGAALRNEKPCRHALWILTGTRTLRLGAGRSQVQILSPRFEKYLQMMLFVSVPEPARSRDGDQTGIKLLKNCLWPRA